MQHDKYVQRGDFRVFSEVSDDGLVKLSLRVQASARESRDFNQCELLCFPAGLKIASVEFINPLDPVIIGNFKGFNQCVTNAVQQGLLILPGFPFEDFNFDKGHKNRTSFN